MISVMNSGDYMLVRCVSCAMQCAAVGDNTINFKYILNYICFCSQTETPLPNTFAFVRITTRETSRSLLNS